VQDGDLGGKTTLEACRCGNSTGLGPSLHLMVSIIIIACSLTIPATDKTTQAPLNWSSPRPHLEGRCWLAGPVTHNVGFFSRDVIHHAPFRYDGLHRSCFRDLLRVRTPPPWWDRPSPQAPLNSVTSPQEPTDVASCRFQKGLYYSLAVSSFLLVPRRPDFRAALPHGSPR